MAKRREEKVHEETRKETHLRRRDEQANRRVYIGLAVTGVLLIALIAAGVLQELVIKPRRPIAVVDGASIALKDYAKRVQMSWFQSTEAITDPQGDSANVLDQMVDEELLRQQAQQMGIVVNPEEVDEAIEQAFGYQRYTPTPSPTPEVSPTPLPSPTPGGDPTATPYPTSTPISLESFQTAYQNYLGQLSTAAQMTEADFRRMFESDLLQQKLYEKVSADVPVTELQVHASHILVSIIDPYPTPTPLPEGQVAPTPDPAATPTPAPRTAEEALARIVEVQQRLAAGEDFAALALEYSDDTGSAAEGGDLGWFGKGQMVPEFETAAFTLQPGQISEPVKTDYGYHLIKVWETDPARERDAYTLAYAQYEAFQNWLTSVRSAAKIEKNWSLDTVPPTPDRFSAQ